MPEELRNILHTFEQFGYKYTYSRTPENENAIDIFTEQGGSHFCTLYYMGYNYFTLADCRQTVYAHYLTRENIMFLVPLLQSVFMSGGWD